MTDNNNPIDPNTESGGPQVVIQIIRDTEGVSHLASKLSFHETIVLLEQMKISILMQPKEPKEKLIQPGGFIPNLRKHLSPRRL